MGRKRKPPEPKHITITRYHLPDGSRCSRDTPGAIKRQEKSESYYAQLPHPETGRNAWHPLKTTDLAAAWIELGKEVDRRELARLGLGDKYANYAMLPIAEHVAAWLAAVKNGGVTAKRLQMLETRIRVLIELAGWKRITDISKSSCLAALARLQQEPHARSPIGRSAQTRNHYLGHARQFSAWLADDHRLKEDRLSGLKPISVEDDRRHDRRAPTDEEIVLLFDHLHGLTPKFPPPWRCRMSGPQRALGYQVAMCSGLRAGELRSLGVDNFDFVGGEVRLRAGRAKNRKRTLQPLPGWLLTRVESWIKEGGKLWTSFPAQWPGRLLKADLALARAAWLDAAATPEERTARESSPTLCYEVEDIDGPLFWDFHSLRHWYVSQMAASEGISPGALQSLVRHSDPTLTLKVYNHARKKQTRGAVDQIPEMRGQQTDANKPIQET